MLPLLRAFHSISFYSIGFDMYIKKVKLIKTGSLPTYFWRRLSTFVFIRLCNCDKDSHPCCVSLILFNENAVFSIWKKEKRKH